MADHWEAEDDTTIYFWGGVLSNWYKSSFVTAFFLKNGEREVQFNTAEQYMMAHKAILHKDFGTLISIMDSDEPRVQKSLGREVYGFDAAMWRAAARNRFYPGLYAKFAQNTELHDLLLSTGDKLLVEASPFDRIWGIGFDWVHAPTAKHNWGENWLGQCLMQARHDLRTGEGLSEYPDWDCWYKQPGTL